MDDKEVKDRQTLIKSINDLLHDSPPKARIQVLGSVIALEFLNQFGYEGVEKFKLFSKNTLKIMRTLVKRKDPIFIATEE